MHNHSIKRVVVSRCQLIDRTAVYITTRAPYVNNDTQRAAAGRYLEVGAVRHVLEVTFQRRQKADVVLGFGVELGQILLEELEGVVDVEVDVEQGLDLGHLHEAVAHGWS